MKLIVGLGNPDLKYHTTRHNIGFMALDYIKKRFNSEGSSFENFIFDKNSNAKISEGVFDSEKLLLVKPQTYMNNSGFSVEKLVNYYKINFKNNLIIIYDDIDLPFGNIKIKGQSSGGHKGMQSIIDNIKTDEIPRIRIGILNKDKDKIKDTASYVLQNFNKSEKEKLENIFENVLNSLKKLLNI